jgi:short subunit dehydrogenase-like uncharacterized protein
MSFLLYGAYGYTGELIARMAKMVGLHPLLAGRDEGRLRKLGEELDLVWIAFNLNESEKIDSALKRVKLVLHAAGPFIHTARPMLEACLRTQRHYLDITGEISVFQMAHSFDQRARDNGIMLMPGVGFDVVPSDCLALFLKDKLPEAISLKLAFAALQSGTSRGTAFTMIENLGEKGAVRVNGKILRVPVGHKTLHFPAGSRQLFAMTIPWGDVFTAYFTTGIPNVEVYMGVPPRLLKVIKCSRYFSWILKSEFVKNHLRRKIEKKPPGPGPEQRAAAKTHLWGEVISGDGRAFSASLQTPEGYTLTAETSILVIRKVLQGNFKPGFGTPAGTYGWNLILEVADTVFSED